MKAEQGGIEPMDKSKPGLSLAFTTYNDAGKCSLCFNDFTGGVRVTSPITSRHFHLFCNTCIESLGLVRSGN